MVQRIKRAARRRRQREDAAEWDRRMAVAMAEGHELWMLLGACNRFEEGHDVNCRCHNGSPVLLDQRMPAPSGGNEP